MTRDEVDELRHRLTRIEERLNLLFGGLAVITVVGNAVIVAAVAKLMAG